MASRKGLSQESRSRLNHTRARIIAKGLASVPHRISELVSPSGYVSFKVQLLPKTLEDLETIKKAPNP